MYISVSKGKYTLSDIDTVVRTTGAEVLIVLPKQDYMTMVKVAAILVQENHLSREDAKKLIDEFMACK